MKDVKFKLTDGVYSIEPHYGATPVDTRTPEEKAAITKRIAKLQRVPKAKPKQYWRLDATWYDKDGNRKQLNKYVCIPDPEDPTKYKWTPKTYRVIGMSDQFGNARIPLKDGIHTVQDAIQNVYPKLKDTFEKYAYFGYTKEANALIPRAVAFKEKLDKILDINSRRFEQQIKASKYTPENRLKIGSEPPTYEDDDDMFVGCYPMPDWQYDKEDGYTDFKCGLLTYHAYVINEYGYREYLHSAADAPDNKEFIINTNSDYKLENLICHPTYKRLFYLIRIANAFDISPRLEEGVFREEGYSLVDVVECEDNAEVIVETRRPKGIVGYCITKSAMRELNQTVNYYEALASMGEDMSDKITIFHENGVDTKEVSKYQLAKNPDEYQEWRLTPIDIGKPPKKYTPKDESEEDESEEDEVVYEEAADAVSYTDDYDYEDVIE